MPRTPARLLSVACAATLLAACSSGTSGEAGTTASAGAGATRSTASSSASSTASGTATAASTEAPTDQQLVERAVAAAAGKQTAGAASGSAEPSFSADSGVRLLARSTPLGGYPASWLAVTEPSQGVPALVVVTQPSASAAATLTRRVSLLDGAQVRAFPSLSSGTPFSAPAGLVIAPDALVTAYGKSLVQPSPSPLPRTVATDPFAAQVRAAEAQLAASVQGAGSATSTQRVLPGTTTVTQADGGALVLATLERTTAITVTPGAEVATPAAFQAAKGPKTLKNKGTWVTQETLAFEVPKGTGQAHLVGADERTVSASGS